MTVTSLPVAKWLSYYCYHVFAGLDPTILFFMGNNRSHDLDPTDAHLIDVIHTGKGILGQWGPNGHADFYVNGGTSQPGCAQNSIFRTNHLKYLHIWPVVNKN